ncbi:TraB/VirB10 family protein [Geoalkalibacter halelectricus]|uniref:TraB/VirB10 family protein n=1 Tax=Geoalkalibacter halelectricus TaxID=2847045 RepID=UPI00266F4FE7|nr:TraB/VirB10 family protein [Geoalkalibacter halelectricus]MDO3380354.1 TraB/VirB10 family protein [Geoalkalibacter halelectricus]
MTIKERWRELAPNTKKTLSVSMVVGVALMVGVVGYALRGEDRQPKASREQARVLTAEDPKTLQRGLVEDVRREQARRDEEVMELRRQLENMRDNPQVAPPPSPVSGDREVVAAPPPPPLQVAQPQSGTYRPPYPGDGQGAGPPPPPVERTVIGGIGQVSAPVEVVREDKKKDKANQIYLPPSFMGATLLSGLDAPTTDNARGNPVPVLIRVQDLAILPNSVKADLKGCFVIAEGVGNLADERVHLRLVTLSCVGKSGESVIDQSIKGFVVDEDGKIGLQGNVVSKMGAAIARSMMAGFFGGAADVVGAASTVTSISPLGTTQTIPTSDLTRAGVAGGISQGFKDVQKFYLDLAKQTMPVVEVGATKRMTLVIEEGVMLNIRENNGGARL